jgi:transcriptional regulator with XRE-family HTH domain
MASALAQVDSRDTVRCDHCGLVQFPASNNLCRRCHIDLDEELELEPEPVTPAPLLIPVPVPSGPGKLALSVRSWRLRRGLSQRELAVRMGTPRTYISKTECGKVTPTLSSLERLAAALGVSIPDLLAFGERRRQDEVDALIGTGSSSTDCFIRKLLPIVSRLTPLAMTCILAQVQDLSEQRRRRSLI